MKKHLMVVPLLVICMIACRKIPDTEKLSASFVVQTAKDPTASFASYKTFYIADTIGLQTSDPNDSIWFDDDARQLVAAVKQNMADRGFTLVPRAARPDLGLTLSAIKDLNLSVIYPGYWWGYWGYWGGCYWGYCGYPPYYPWGGMVYSVPTGTLILDMIDLKNAQANQKYVVVWGSVMSGGLGYTNDDLQLGLEAIDQSFIQSDYIRTNQ